MGARVKSLGTKWYVVSITDRVHRSNSKQPGGIMPSGLFFNPINHPKMKTFTITQFGSTTEVYIRQRNYPNGRPALELIDVTDHIPYAVATVNLPDVLLEDNEVLVKDYSENEGILDFLIDNNIVTLPTSRDIV